MCSSVVETYPKLIPTANSVVNQLKKEIWKNQCIKKLAKDGLMVEVRMLGLCFTRNRKRWVFWSSSGTDSSACTPMCPIICTFNLKYSPVCTAGMVWCYGWLSKIPARYNFSESELARWDNAAFGYWTQFIWLSNQFTLYSTFDKSFSFTLHFLDCRFMCQCHRHCNILKNIVILM